MPRGCARIRSALVVLATAGLLASPAGADEEWPASTQPLFRIERSVNANIVQYDAVLTEDGGLDPERPVIAYWIRLAEDGRRQGLSWMERKLAYGFEARFLDDGTVLLDMAAEIRRPLKVVRNGDRWEARTRINGNQARITRIFVQVRDGRPVPEVLYIDLDGVGVESGAPVHERYRPRR